MKPLLFAPLLALLLAPLLRADDYSRFCKRPGEGDFLRPGTYEGTWELRYSIVLPMGPHQTLSANGKFRFTVAGSSGGSKLTGTMERSTRMEANMPGGARADQRLEGTGSLSLDGEPMGDLFVVKAQHSASGEIRASHPRYTHVEQQTDSGDDRMEFTANSGDCQSASGSLTVPTLAGVVDSMRSQGASVNLDVARWEMKRVEDVSDQLQRFKQELEEPPPAGIHWTREAEARRWWMLLDSAMQREPEDLHSCLHDLWIERVGKVHALWVTEDTAQLNAWTGAGDWPTLQDHLQRALDSSRGLCLLGLDTCLADSHQRLWEAIHGALSRHLTRMAEGGAPIVDILSVARSADLLGAVSPPLRAQYTAAVQAQAVELADAAWTAYQTALKAANGQRMDPSVKPLLYRAIRTEKIANLLGAQLSRVVQ